MLRLSRGVRAYVLLTVAGCAVSSPAARDPLDGSSGDYGTATYDDLTADATTAVEFLRGRPEVAPEEVGVWGLSQGALIAPRLATRIPSLRFIVAVSPPGVQIGIASAYQDSVRLVSRGFSSADVSRAASLNRGILAWLSDGRSEAALADELERYANERWRRASSLPPRLPALPQREGWYWRGRALDPIPSWRALETPVLVVFGGADELLPADISAARIQRALREAANADATVRVFPGANHVLRLLPPSSEGRWDWPRTAPGYLDLVTRWAVGASWPSGRWRSLLVYRNTATRWFSVFSSALRLIR